MLCLIRVWITLYRSVVDRLSAVSLNTFVSEWTALVRCVVAVVLMLLLVMTRVLTVRLTNLRVDL